jgi:hypothetical protein
MAKWWYHHTSTESTYQLEWMLLSFFALILRSTIMYVKQTQAGFRCVRSTACESLPDAFHEYHPYSNFELFHCFVVDCV